MFKSRGIVNNTMVHLIHTQMDTIPSSIRLVLRPDIQNINKTAVQAVPNAYPNGSVAKKTNVLWSQDNLSSNSNSANLRWLNGSLPILNEVCLKYWFSKCGP